MKLFFTLLLVLWGMPAWAVEYVPIQPDGKCRLHNTEWNPRNGKCGGFNIFSGEDRPIDCLAQMKAAMRAVEEYLVPSRFGIYGEGNTWYETKRIYPGDKVRHDEAMLKWETAKKACWQEPTP